jgi:hypothetical protein
MNKENDELTRQLTINTSEYIDSRYKCKKHFCIFVCASLIITLGNVLITNFIVNNNQEDTSNSGC